MLQALPHDAGLIRELADQDIERLIDILEPTLSKGAVGAQNAPAAAEHAVAEHISKMAAEGKLEQAHQLVVSTHAHRIEGWEARPDALLRLAHKLFEAGGEVNYNRSSEVAQVVINALAFAPVPVEQTTKSKQTAKARGAGWWASSDPSLQVAGWVAALVVSAAILLYLFER